MITQESSDLYNFIKNKIDNIQSPELTKLYKFFDQKKLIDLQLISYSSSHNFSINEDINHLIFASDTIKNRIQYMKNKYIYQYQYKNIIIHINVFTLDLINITSFMDKLIHYLNFILSIQKITKKEITINYYLTNKKKEWIKGDIPSINEVNSGSCQNNSHNNHSIINIWRKEEVLKVTLHEMIHALCFDVYKDTQNIINYYRDKYNISSNQINSNEAYTELWANIINCYLISKNKNYNFSQLISIEHFFSNVQSQKIMNLIPNKNKTIDINKDTNILAYFIIKTEIFNRLNVFLKHCRLYHTNYIKIKNIKLWLLFLKKNKKIKKLKVYSSNKKSIQKNLKMSAMELHINT